MNIKREHERILGRCGFLPDAAFPFLDEVTYFRNKIWCEMCKSWCYKTGEIWLRYHPDDPRYDTDDDWVWGKRYVFCPTCHWVFNIRSEARQKNWRGLLTAEEARKRLGRIAK